jgi:hypothetical protein
MSKEDEYKRIDLILASVREVWRLRPDKRFGQLLVDIDCDSKVPDLFLLKDEDLLKILDTKFKEYRLLDSKLQEKLNDNS